MIFHSIYDLFLGKTLNATFSILRLSSPPVAVAHLTNDLQNEHFVLEWYDRHRLSVIQRAYKHEKKNLRPIHSVT